MKTNCNKKSFLLSVCLFAGGTLFAGNEKCIDYYDGGMTETARICMVSQLSTASGVELAEAYFYLGKISLDQNRQDLAADYFRKSAEAAPEYPYSLIGQGHLALLKNNKVEAENLFNKAAKMDKKDSNIPVQTALAYGKNKMYAEAFAQLEKARKINKSNPKIYVIEGDIILMQNPSDVGNASGKYDMAIFFDKKCKEAYIKAASVYRKINIDVSLEKINSVLEIDPDYTPAYLEMGETYFANGMYIRSAAGYKRYMEAPGVSEEYQDKYASALFVAKDFKGVLDQANKTLSENPKNPRMLRLKKFVQYELKNYDAALASAENYFSIVPPSEHAWQDYRYYGLILKENKQDDKAIIYFEKAVEIEPSQAELYKELAMAYEDKKEYAKAIPNYEKFMNTTSGIALTDILAFGRCYWALGNSIPDTEKDKRNGYFAKADSIFTQITENSPNLFQGYWWRARANAAIDPETKEGLAKPYFELTLQKIEEAKSNPVSVMLEANQYLGYYYYLQYTNAVKNKQRGPEVEAARTSAINYWQKVLELEPGSEGAKQALNILNKK